MSTLCPVLVSYVSDVSTNGRKSRRQNLREMIAQVEAYFNDGEIPNVIYGDAKYIFNSELDRAYESIRHEHVSGRWDELSPATRKFTELFGIVYLHQVDGLIKRGEAIEGDENHPYRVKMLGLLKDVQPLAEIMAVLKDMTIKRQPKAPEEKKEGYVPPTVNSAAEKQVVALLEKVTEESYQNLKTTLITYFHNGHRIFLEALAENEKLTPFEFFVGKCKIAPDYVLADVMEKVRMTFNDGLTDWQRFYVSQGPSLVATAFANHATKVADEYRTFFVHKNFRKIASIVDGKKMNHNACELSRSVSLTGIEGTFYFDFEDGSSFKVVNKVVHSYSVYGKAFQRFPLTFTEVVMPNGKPMSRPSQERMNIVFLKG